MKLLRSIPALPVREVAGAADYYRDRLGFSIGHVDERFAIVTRDGLELHLWAADDETWSRRRDVAAPTPVVSGAESFLAGTASCRIEVSGIDRLYEEMRATGALYSSDTVIEETTWGTREFPVLDPERNLLTFYERTGG